MEQELLKQLLDEIKSIKDDISGIREDIYCIQDQLDSCESSSSETTYPIKKETPLEKILRDFKVNFDWERVAEAMSLLDWQWVTGDGGIAVPNVETIKKHALDLVESTYASYVANGYKPTTMSCGGFAVNIQYDEETKSDDVELEFVLTDWRTNNAE